MLKQSDANMDDPKEFAAWVTGALKVSLADYLTLHDSDAAHISEQLWQAGLRHHPELQTHVMMNVTPGLSLGAEWRPKGSVPRALQREKEVPVESMSLTDRVALMERLKATGVGAHDIAPPAESHAIVLEDDPEDEQ